MAVEWNFDEDLGGTFAMAKDEADLDEETPVQDLIQIEEP